MTYIYDFLGQSILRRLLCGLLLLLLAACAGDQAVQQRDSVEVLYNRAIDQLIGGNPALAARAFDEVERQHPYSIWARKAQLMAAYAYYETNEYDDAILAAQRFVELHPGNRDTPYAYYIIAVSYYEQIADVGRDQKITELALNSLQEVIDRYPATAYARDARLKIDLARDHLAGKEMEIGRYYLRQGALLAAINRFQVVVREYQTTNHVPEALHRLTEAYIVLGLTDEAQSTAAVLGHNYPGSEWYRDSYALLEEGSDGSENSSFWLTRAWNSIVD